MRNRLICVVLLLMTFVSCKKEVDSVDEKMIIAQEIEGSWELHSFFIAGKEGTDKPNDSIFVLPPNSQLLTFTYIENAQGKYERTPGTNPGFKSIYKILGKRAIEITEYNDYVQLKDMELTDSELKIYEGYSYSYSLYKRK